MTGEHRGRRWLQRARSLELRVTLRALLRSPAYTWSSILLIALGIGAMAATYGAIQSAVLRPLPLPAPQELVAVQNVDIPYNMGPKTPQMTAHLADVAGLDVFSGVAAQAVGAMNLSGGGNGDAQRVPVAYVSAGFFGTMGVAPQAGRTFTADEGTAGGDWHVAVLSHRLWMQRFGGDRGALGHTILLNGHGYRVIGVMPADFNFPSAPAVWLPLPLPISNAGVFEAFGNFIPVEIVARLRQGTSIRTADLAVGRLEKQYASWSYMAKSAAELVQPLQGTLITARSRHALLGLGAAALLVLLLAALNFAGLLAARTIRRLPDLQVRVLLGASRADVTRMMGTEALLLGVAGAAGGIVVARASLPLLDRLIPPQVLAVAPPSVNSALILFAVGASLFVAALVTLAFARAFGGRNIVLHGTTRHVTRTGLSWHVGEWLGGLQIALALLLVTGAGVLGQRVYQLATVDTGMNLDGVVAANLILTHSNYGSAAAITECVTRTVAKLARAPGVQAVSAVNVLPIAGRGGFGEQIKTVDVPIDSLMVRRYAATPGYFRTMGIPLLEGRDFLPDEPQAWGVIVNALTAKALWHGAPAVGRQVIIDNVPRPVVGVVGDVRTRQLSVAPVPQIYVPFDRRFTTAINIVVRGNVSRSALIARVRDAVRSMDPQQPVSDIQNRETLRLGTIAGQRSAGLLLAAFGLIALVVATVGVYALTAYRVVARRREIAVRVALGATPGAVLRRILGRVAVSGGAGLAVGVLATLGTARLVAGLIPGAPVVGYGELVIALVVLFGAVMTAAFVPALRGVRADPMEAFRSE